MHLKYLNELKILIYIEELVCNYKLINNKSKNEQWN